MIKIRDCIFETNSSSSNTYYFSNTIIDTYLNIKFKSKDTITDELKEYFSTNEFQSALYSSIKQVISEHQKELKFYIIKGISFKIISIDQTTGIVEMKLNVHMKINYTRIETSYYREYHTRQDTELNIQYDDLVTYCNENIKATNLIIDSIIDISLPTEKELIDKIENADDYYDYYDSWED